MGQGNDESLDCGDSDGKLVRGHGSLCGYGQHMPEYWKAYSFGAPSKLLTNGKDYSYKKQKQ